MHLIRLDSSYRVVQVYAPFTARDGEHVEEFLDELKLTLIAKFTHTVDFIWGDFIAKLGNGRKVEERYISRHGIGELHSRGNIMAPVLQTIKTVCRKSEMDLVCVKNKKYETRSITRLSEHDIF